MLDLYPPCHSWSQEKFMLKWDTSSFTSLGELIIKRRQGIPDDTELAGDVRKLGRWCMSV